MWRIFGSLGDHQNCGEIPSVHWKIFSSVEGYYQCIGGYSVLLRDIISTRDAISTVEGYHEYCNECETVNNDVSTTAKISNPILSLKGFQE